MKLTATKTFEFEAAHSLPKYDGLCSNLHGHSYRLEVTVGFSTEDKNSKNSYIGTSEKNTPPADAMVLDFKIIKQIVKAQILDLLDHANLNEVDTDDFPHWMPTAENTALWIFHQLIPMLAGVELQKIKLWETSTSFVEVEK